MKLSEHTPTAFDHSAAQFFDSEDPRRNWLVVPVGQNRDSRELETSNFAAALEILGGESETVEVHRFGHWACGWYEIIIVDPSREAEVEAIENRLENYPVLDEDDFSNREHEAYLEDWQNWACSDFISGLKNEFDLQDSTVDFLEGLDHEPMMEFFESCNPSGDYYDGEGCNVRSSVDKCTREQLATFLWNSRKEV